MTLIESDSGLLRRSRNGDRRNLGIVIGSARNTHLCDVLAKKGLLEEAATVIHQADLGQALQRLANHHALDASEKR